MVTIHKLFPSTKSPFSVQDPIQNAMNSQSTDPELAVPLPPSVNELLRKICADQSFPPVEAGVRRRLAERGELGALDILWKVDSAKVRKSLGGLIIHLLDRSPLTPSPTKKTCVISVAGSQSSKWSPGCSPSTNSVRCSGIKREAVNFPCLIDLDSPAPREIGRTDLRIVPYRKKSQEAVNFPCLIDVDASTSSEIRRTDLRPVPYHNKPQEHVLLPCSIGVDALTASEIKRSDLRAVSYHNKPQEHVLLPCSIDVNASTVSEIGRADKEVKEALGELEFRKQFLILSYIGGKELHIVTTAEQIKWLKDFPMVQFEARVWELFGRGNVSNEDRRMNHDWNPKKTHLYDCHVSTEGDFRFKGPFLNRPRTHLQKVLGDDNVLRVKFAEDSKNLGVSSHNNPCYEYTQIAIKDGISVGLRRYFFFVFKDGGKEDKKKNPTSSTVKCYFIRLHSDALIDKMEPYILSNRTIREARSLFMHAHTLPNAANYMARFSLILSKTYSLPVDLTSVKMEIEDDFYCLDQYGNCVYRNEKPLIHSDGTGEISEDLALMCPKNIYEGVCMNDKDVEVVRNLGQHVDSITEAGHLRAVSEEPPMLIQCRLFNIGYAIKGTFLVNKKLRPRTIKVRKSMVKVEQDKELPENFPGSTIQNSLEVVGTSNPPKRTHLSRNLIALLSHGGVPDQFFLDLLEDALNETDGAFRNTNSAIKVAMNHGKSEDFMIARLIGSGLPLEEPYMQHRLTLLLKKHKTSLREGRIYIPESYYLMGTVDPTGELESNEVCIILDSGQVSGKVIVYRNPGLHFGDVHVLKATYVKELESVVGNAKYAIFFSKKGPRSVADAMAGGDFDGDMYWISRHPVLLNHFKQSEPWIPNLTCKGKDESKKVNQFREEEFENALFHRFLALRFQPNFAMGEAAQSCQALMDRFLTLEDDCNDEKNRVRDNIIKLNDIYSLALDAPKKGLKVEVPKALKAKCFPHYMEKKSSYISKSILGKIYDRVIAYQEEDDSSQEIWKLPEFDVTVPQSCLSKWESYYKEYRSEMSQSMAIQDRDLRNEAACGVKRKYKKLLYGAEELDLRTGNMTEIFNEALAIYHVCYDHARANQNASLCSFAWSVAGSALCLYLTSKEVVAPILFVPSALTGILQRKKYA